MESHLPVQIIFYAFAAMTIGSAAVVVFSRSLIHSAFALLFTFFGVAGLYAFLGADFLAATQMVIYVGGILVLLLFGVMLTHKLYDLNLRSETYQMLPALVVVLAVFGLLATVMMRARWHEGSRDATVPTTAAIGELFMNDYILPFEAASILLLIALIGAAMIVRRKSE
ncbi:MAG: NADH-quinone oxidoreductase subunit J [Acidobacteria bacterium]|nr:NADH-quinone oxidoreductase subunit J [Acidobacteriota bacterium]